MKLLMYLDNDLIDSASLERDKIIFPGYISSFIRLLKEKHGCIIQQSPRDPEFLVDDILISATEQVSP